METLASADGTTIAYDRSGSGPALITVLGAFCNRFSSKPLAAILGAHFTVYEYDRRGRGDSGDSDTYSVRSEIDDLAALVAVAMGESDSQAAPFVYGHSSGAILALEAAAAGVPMGRLAVYEPPYTGSDGAANERFIAKIQALLDAGNRDEAAAEFMLMTGAPPAVVAGFRSNEYWPTMLSLAHTLPYDLTLSAGGDLPAARLSGIGIPVLALGGGDSPPWGPRVAEDLANVIPAASYRVLDGQTHGVADEVLAGVLDVFFS